jgi:hypothetical protein
MAGSLRALGIVGAALLLLGPVLIGVGWANLAYAEHQYIICTGNCNDGSNELNASYDMELLFGLGLVSIGVGLGLVFACATQLMGRSGGSS